MAIENPIRLDLYESRAVVPVQSFAAGTYTFKQGPAGNSVLSTLWVKTISGGASVTVNIWEPGPSGGETPGQRINLGSHTVITTADTSDRAVFTRIHDKIFIEIVVAGGSAELGIYMTTVSDFPQDSPFLDGQIVDLLNDKGSANVIYDPGDGKFYLMRGTAGVQDVNVLGGNISVSIAGKTTPSSAIFNIPLANTEYMLSFQPNMKAYRISNHSNSTIKYSWQAGQSNTQYDIIFPACSIWDEGIIGTNLKVYVRSNQPNTDLSIVEWI